VVDLVAVVVVELVKLEVVVVAVSVVLVVVMVVLIVVEVVRDVCVSVVDIVVVLEFNVEFGSQGAGVAVLDVDKVVHVMLVNDVVALRVVVEMVFVLVKVVVCQLYSYGGAVVYSGRSVVEGGSVVQQVAFESKLKPGRVDSTVEVVVVVDEGGGGLGGIDGPSGTPSPHLLTPDAKGTRRYHSSMGEGHHGPPCCVSM